MLLCSLRITWPCVTYTLVFKDFIVNTSQSGESDTKIMINHKEGQEKSVKLVFIKKSQNASVVIKSILIVGIEGDNTTDIPNIACTECPVVFTQTFYKYYIIGLHL